MKAVSLALFALILLSPPRGKATDERLSKSEIDRRSAQAEELFEQGHTPESKKIYESLFSSLRDQPASGQLGLVLNGLSKIAAAEGEYKRASELAQESASTYRKSGDLSGESHARNNQGIAEIQMGKYPAAQQTLQDALELSQRARDSENEVQVLNNLGSAFYYPGNYSEAQHRYDDAMNLVNESTGAKWSAYWRQITSFNQATLYQRLGRYDKAMEIYREVQKLSSSLTPSDRAHLLANLGALYRRLGDSYKALDVYDAAKKLYSGLHDIGGELTVIKNIGIVYALDMQDLGRAESIFRSAISLATKTHNRREEMQAHLYLGETLFRAQSLATSRAEFEQSGRIAAELGTTEEQWKSAYGLGEVAQSNGNTEGAEAYYRQAIANIEKTRSQLQLTALRSEFFADKREAYDALITLLMQKNAVSEAFTFLEKSRARNFQDHLRAKNRESQGSQLTLESARASLAPETALLEFWTAGDRFGLIWCTRDQAGLVFKQLSSTEMSDIRAFLDGMPNVLGDDWRERSTVLSALFPANTSFLRGIRHLMIVPDGWISYVPFDLVPATDSRSVLIEQFDVSYLPTAAILTRERTREKLVQAPWTQELIAFGDPSADSSQPSGDADELDRAGTQRLPYSSQEISAIAGLARGRTELFLRENDLKTNFLAAAPKAAFVLHVSTHAFADGNNPENSRLLFSPSVRNGSPEYVFLRELYDMELSHVRLATISACDTEKGKIIRGEGVQAFSRALLSAGASSSLTTLWRVDDEPAAEFMKQFYHYVLHERKPKAEALRLVKLKLLQSNTKLAYPRLWAAFVLNGDGATPLPRVLSWSEITVLVAVLAGVATLLKILWRQRRTYRQHG